MSIKKKSLEEQLIIEIIFGKNKIQYHNLEKVCLKKIIKILSKHYIIPLFYVKIKKKEIENYFEKEFVEYLRNIYNLNKERNIILLDELNSLQAILDKNQIKFIFIKGCANLKNNIYDDVGERMIGDIDFLFNPDDKNKIEQILDENNYFYKIGYPFLVKRHLKRRIKKNFLFAIEPHINILRKKNFLLKFNFFKKNDVEKNYPSFYESLLINIYNHEINDMFYSKISFSYRGLYDSYLLLNKIKDHKLLKLNKELNNHLTTLNELGIYEYKTKFKLTILRKLKLILCKNSKFFFRLNYYYVLAKKRAKFLTIQIKEYIKNKEYRAHVKYKLKTIFLKTQN
tara:strand:- start:1034 stop:2056 length:1023 start_codon:yes stop_codon:yes gene_type:complete